MQPCPFTTKHLPRTKGKGQAEIDKTNRFNLQTTFDDSLGRVEQFTILGSKPGN